MLYVIIYVLAICLANISVAIFGPAVTPINAFLLISLDMSIRDRLHDLWSGENLFAKMSLLIAVSGFLSFLINPLAGIVAIASMSAFLLSSITDSVVYHANIKKSWTIRANVSNAAGAAIDSVVFPVIAFGSLMPEIVISQFLAKVAGGILWSYIISRISCHSNGMV